MKKMIFAMMMLAGCGGDDACNPDSACTVGSPYHYRFCSGGSADNCFYQAGDGTKFHCTTCGDCSNAQSEVAGWCSEQPRKATGSVNGTCSQAVSCPTGAGSYAFCTGGTCGFKTSDGSSFACNSCGDCTAASQKAANWCYGTSSTSNTGSDSSCSSRTAIDCQTCCGQAHPQGANYLYQEYVSCGCAYCASSCNSSGDVCHGGSGQSQACSDCMAQVSTNQCASTIRSTCQSSSDCSAYQICLEHCPAS